MTYIDESATKIPRNRAPIRWIDLPSLARITVGVSIGLLALAAIGAVLP